MSYRLFIAAAGLLLTVGCSAPQAEVANPFEIDVREYDRIYRAVCDELKDRGFTLDSQAYRFGKLTTRPRGSGSFVEFWRGDNQSVEQAIESTFNDQRRIVKVTIDPQADNTSATEQPGVYGLHVEVIVQRRRVVTRHLSGSSAGWAVFANLTDVPRQWQERSIDEVYWQPVGRDDALEQQLIAAIIRRSFESQ